MRIDVHTHYRTPRYNETMSEFGAADEFNFVGIMAAYHAASTARQFANGVEPLVAKRVADMDKWGIDYSIIGLGGGQPHFRDRDKAVRIAEIVNEDFNEVTDLSAGRIRAFGTIPLPHIDESIRVIGQLLDEQGHAGISMGCSIAGLPLDHESFAPVWAELNARKAVVYIHPATMINIGVGTGDFHLAPDFMSPAEIGITVSRLIVTGFIQKYPDIRFIIATFGGGIPFLAHRFDRGFRQHDAEAYEAMGGVVRHYRHFWYDSSVTEDPLTLEAARLVYGADRILLGTDVPRGANPIEEGVRFIEDSPYLNAQEKRAILDENAAQLFDFPERTAAAASQPELEGAAAR